MRKTPPVAYYQRKIRTTSRSRLYEEWDDAPITNQEMELLEAILEGLTYKEMAQKFHLTTSGVAKRKRAIFNKMHQYDMRQITR